ncbi:hypothetical protein J437_LFUL011916 [Ladona fulva]|uniref:G-protein coupled receptors family 1 profile domain-containing protein n=1 Tax=Ladona fulva TaxID=123851 RepID=A0A8K0JTZ2_LADFU|nr:hypothetical protein J437_LFUL011916 [Ladona fulva]
MHLGRRRKVSMLRLLGATQRREIKTTQSLAIIVLFFIICWIPLHTINFVKALCPDCPVEGPITLFSIILSHLNSAVNPILYAYHLKDYRAALRAIFHCNEESEIQETTHRKKPIPTISQTPSKPMDNLSEVQPSQDVDQSTKSLSIPEVLSPENLVNAPFSSFLGQKSPEKP